MKQVNADLDLCLKRNVQLTMNGQNVTVDVLEVNFQRYSERLHLQTCIEHWPIINGIIFPLKDGGTK